MMDQASVAKGSNVIYIRAAIIYLAVIFYVDPKVALSFSAISICVRVRFDRYVTMSKSCKEL